MAVTRKQGQEQQQAPAYTGLQGVSENTAQQLGNYQQGYKPSDTVTAAQKQLQQVQAQKPQSYSSKYGPALDNILQQIQNPQDFKYDFNGDELFKSYADIYSRKGRQAMMDTVGNAAALTGGYGNSYASQVGQQTYDEYMNDLYSIGLDLRDRAYQQYGDRRADLYNQYGTLSQQDQLDYGRYRDEVGDWQTERDYFTNMYNNERNFDYNDYNTMLNYWNTQAGAENADYWTGKNFDETQRQYNETLAENKRQYDATLAENVRQFDATLNWNKMSNDQKYAASWVSSILANGQMPSLDLLKAAGLSEADAQKLMAQLTATGGGSGGTGKKKYYADQYGMIYEKDKDGNARVLSQAETDKLAASGYANVSASEMDKPVFGTIVSQAMEKVKKNKGNG